MKHRNILLTGVSRGLGNALCRAYAENGHRIAGCARSDVPLQGLRQSLGEGHHFSAVDLTSDKAVKDWVTRVVAEWGVPDLVINNASIINENAPLWEVPIDEFEQLIATNVTAVFSVIRHIVPVLIDKGDGVIANISSGWGRSVSADVAPYCASKWAIEGLTLALAEELPKGIAAVSVNPGIINTEMLQSCFGASASNAPEPDEWVENAMPFFLKLNQRHNGQQLSI